VRREPGAQHARKGELLFDDGKRLDVVDGATGTGSSSRTASMVEHGIEVEMRARWGLHLLFGASHQRNVRIGLQTMGGREDEGGSRIDGEVVEAKERADGQRPRSHQVLIGKVPVVA
jgi:hypothetical protein